MRHDVDEIFIYFIFFNTPLAGYSVTSFHFQTYLEERMMDNFWQAPKQFSFKGLRFQKTMVTGDCKGWRRAGFPASTTDREGDK